MADKSSIEWCEATLNAWTGCRKVSAGCAKCYLPRTPPFRVAGRKFVHGETVYVKDGEVVPGQASPVVYHLERIDKMVRRKKPTVYFVNSLSDVFLEDVPDDVIAQLFVGMASAPQHTFQVLTKRPERMHELLSTFAFWDMVYARLPRELRRDRTHSMSTDAEREAANSGQLPPWAWLKNVWLGVTVENRAQVGRADVLRATPAAVRFLSCEPLLGPLIKFHGWRSPRDRAHDRAPESWWPDRKFPETPEARAREPRELDLSGMDWVIAGGESGPGARPCRVEWLRDLRDACLNVCVACERCGGYGALDPLHGGPAHELFKPELCIPCPNRPKFFLKQLGGHPDKRGKDAAILDGLRWAEMPPVGQRAALTA